jgi:hypothetical protein
MRPLDFIKRHHLLVAILLLGIVLRVYHLDFQSLWIDEIHTMLDSSPAHTLSEVHASVAAADPHPP